MNGVVTSSSILAVAIGGAAGSVLRYLVAVGASLLLAPVLWDHYLALVVLPAALLASRGRVWALALPLLTWLPASLGFVLALLATLLPLVAGDPARTSDQAPHDRAGRDDGTDGDGGGRDAPMQASQGPASV